MSNWKITNGDFYVAKSGSLDPSAVGDQNQPFRTLQQAVDAAAQVTKSPVVIIIGAGNYVEDLSYSGAHHLAFSGDGRVRLAPANPGGVWFNQRGGAFRIDLNHVEILDTSSLLSGATVQMGLSHCQISNATLQFNHRQSDFRHCVFQNTTLTATVGSTGFAHISKCSFLNSTVRGTANSNEGLGAISDSYFDGTSRLEDLIGSRIGVFNTNNFRFGQGRVTSGFELEIDNTTYTSLGALQQTFPQWNTLSMNADPLFNQATFEDMTLSDNSPMAYKGSDGKHIGAWEIAHSYGPGSNALDPSFVQLNGVEYASGSYRLMSGVVEGTIETQTIDLQSKQTLGVIRLFATQTYPGEVIDSSNRTDSPNRQTYEMRYGDDPRNMSNYLVFEWDAIPTYNGPLGLSRAPIGNGEPGFDIRSAMQIEAQYVQLRVTLRNNGIEA